MPPKTRLSGFIYEHFLTRQTLVREFETERSLEIKNA